jgi:Tol biopolymer transport system component
VYRFGGRDFRKLHPADPNQVESQVSNGAGGIDSQNDAFNRSGRLIVMESAADPIGENADGNTEIFIFDTKKSTWVQLTHTLAPVDNRRPTADNKQILFDSNADFLGGNADGNRELFLATFNSGAWAVRTQVTDTLDPVENHAGQVARRGRIVAFESNGDFVGANPDANREIFVIEKGVFTQVTDTLPPFENVHPDINPHGRFVVFESTAELVPEDVGASNRRVFMYDRLSNRTLRLSRSLFGDNFVPRISRGRFVVWESTGNLTGHNPDHLRVLYLFDRRRDN